MLEYETVARATTGDPLAADEVLRYFDSTINRLCTHPVIYGDGHTENGVDLLMKTQLQGKLLQAMLRFTV